MTKASSSGQKATGRYVTRSSVSDAPRTTARATTTGEFTVALPSKSVQALNPRKSGVRAVMQVLSERIAESRESGRATGFWVDVDPNGQPRVRAEQAGAATPAEPPADNDDLEAALAAARERGRLRAAEILSGQEMLSAEAFAELLGVSRVTINAKRQKHEVLGLDGAKRGFRFPAWQVDENGKPFAALPQLFERLGDSPWTVYRFLIQRHPELEGASGLDALRRGRTEEVLDAAESVAAGAFG
ncbi:XRE family transcriptional regulator [Phenylobacterium soli]|uniref:XRE family transcriptional regulator n=1 Tax=Phenylobacterium soli TaxID=2170551 RepID=A0A328AKB4_9CAUL|nr:XRE family transcriptional regulator [Phenylobacterium soli]RAK54911.1 XRE family transcriptional regulator [Phenylobacterium soli]